MGASNEEVWRSTDNPRHLLRLTRVRPSGRRYLLLACAVARHLIPESQTGVGTRVLDVIERFAVAQPNKGVRTHIWRQVVLPNVPELPDPLPYTSPIANWIRAFAERIGPMSCVRPADINVLFADAFPRIEGNARRSAVNEKTQLCYRVWPAVGPKSAPRLTIDELREEVVSRFAPERREAARARWAGVTDKHAASTAASFLVTERVKVATDAASARACELIRDVFANPFRPPVIEPGWLACNHGAVRHIAEQIAASGNFTDLPILADALEDAGCRDEDLLRHCREERMHVPGCWALDAVRGR